MLSFLAFFRKELNKFNLDTNFFEIPFLVRIQTLRFFDNKRDIS